MALIELIQRMAAATSTPMRLLTFTALAVIAVLFFGCSRQQQAPNQAVPVSAPNSDDEIGWVDADGKFTRLTEYRGHVLVLDFYATWCQPCRRSIPRLMTLQQKYESKGFRIVGLNVGGPDDRVKVAAFAKELKISYPLGFPTKALTDLLLKGDLEIPQTFVFKPDGTMIARYIGNEDTTSDDIDKMIDDLMKSQE
jgi:thiol-disulfide isomerase/thioredoxin